MISAVKSSAKITCVAVACTLALGAGVLSGCSTNASVGGSASTSASSASSTSTSNSGTTSQTTAVGEGFTAATIDEQVLLDQDGVTVTAKSLDTAAGNDVALAIEVKNDSTADITVFPSFVGVNGYTVAANDAIEAGHGETVDGYFTIVGQSLQDYNITDIADITLCVSISAGSPYTDGTLGDSSNVMSTSFSAFASNPVDIHTSLYDKVTTEYSDRGELIWDTDVIKVYQQEYVISQELGIAAQKLWVVNETPDPIMFQYTILGVNGLTVEGNYTEQIAPNSRCLTYIYVDNAIKNAGLQGEAVSNLDVSFEDLAVDGSTKASSGDLHLTLHPSLNM